MIALDEAIKHAEEVAEGQKNECKACADEHEQLAEWLKDYKRLLEQEPCEDVIRRADAEALFRNARSKLNPSDYKTADEFNTRDLMLLNAEQFIHLLPSVRPQEPKTGHWIKVTNGRGGHECDLCHEYAPSYQSGKEYLTNYCPNCGAKMIEPQESEKTE